MRRLTRAGVNAVTGPFRWLFVTAAIYFLSAGRTDVLRAWAYFGVYFAGALLSAYVFAKRIPELMNQRGAPRSGTKAWDLPIVIGYFLMALIAVPMLAGLDLKGGRIWGLGSFVWGVALYTGALALSAYAMLHNPFFEGTVRIQTDREQSVVNTGPYRIVRHPGNLSMILGAYATPFALGSQGGAIVATAMAALVAVRTHLEDKALASELPGYDSYRRAVKYRLIPFVW